jgi:hypothetical protein
MGKRARRNRGQGEGKVKGRGCEGKWGRGAEEMREGKVRERRSERDDGKKAGGRKERGRKEGTEGAGGDCTRADGLPWSGNACWLAGWLHQAVDWHVEPNPLSAL